MERIDIKFSFNGRNYQWAADMENVNEFTEAGEPYIVPASRSKFNAKNKPSAEIVTDAYEKYWSIELDSFDDDDYHIEIFFKKKVSKDGERMKYDTKMEKKVNVWNDTDKAIEIDGERIAPEMMEVFEVSFDKIRAPRKPRAPKAESTKIQQKEAEKTTPDTFREYRDAIIYCDKRGYEHEAGAMSPDGTVLNWETGRYQTKVEFERYCRTRYND